MRMTAYYGFTCLCGYEFDLEPSWAEHIGTLRCRSCGRLIQTASSQATPYQEPTDSPRESVDAWSKDWQIQSKGEPVPLLHRWWKSKSIVGERKKRELVLSCERRGKQKFTVTFSESYLDEGRHPLVVESESFVNYKDAVKFYLDLAGKFAPEEIIAEVRDHLKSFTAALP
jgi:hypothetical protein